MHKRQIQSLAETFTRSSVKVNPTEITLHYYLLSDQSDLLYLNICTVTVRSEWTGWDGMYNTIHPNSRQCTAIPSFTLLYPLRCIRISIDSVKVILGNDERIGWTSRTSGRFPKGSPKEISWTILSKCTEILSSSIHP